MPCSLTKLYNHHFWKLTYSLHTRSETCNEIPSKVNECTHKLGQPLSSPENRWLRAIRDFNHSEFLFFLFVYVFSEIGAVE
jgi:hypothetical protein